MKTNNTQEQLLNEFNSVLAETEQLLSSASNAGTDKLGAMKASMEQGLAEAGVRLAKIREASVAQASAAAQAADEYVQESPWRAVGIAAAVAGLAGVIAGILITRR